ncbi:MAG: carbonic anhydrase [Neisseriaceae bacterium]|jgi:carbonic anhydrase
MEHDIADQIIKLLQTIQKTNYEYVDQQKDNIKQFSKSQSPIATLVMCCDSRAHTTSFTYNPENNFFIVRNIGNQYILNQGCVEFGVSVLNTPLLIFLGHTQCGAINASMSDYSNLPSSIIREIDHLALSIKKSELHGNSQQQLSEAVINNVNQQVELALKDFSFRCQERKLLIIGMVLDLDNSLKNGYGHIGIINVNGETNVSKLKKIPGIKNFFNNV